MNYEYFDHTADIGMRMQADSFEELLAAAGRGLTELITPQAASIQSKEWRRVELQNEDRALLLFDLLSEMLYHFDVERLVFGEVHVEPVGLNGIVAKLGGERFDPALYAQGHELKAVTYHGLTVEEKNGKWQGEVIFDI